ncbi:cell division topological specificity factor [Marchantia polymorpha subsp. ruderalis]|uniref:Plastid division regulator MinE n=2 Tax=Marchantia polymorpha TaxID=3197 RepID=A0A176WJI5_MARPO|nr:hypothetical protein AXG93_786s1110 [Marchantia polymorpha subsp. ruderalis]PTQ44135.1 hypothetical protein MARPO_0021s0017 [Marchantia polymorpha]BBN01211.1 hypothetical protein Mp_2g05610 [Marchantia polymorpha subsp. ruderalis]|eukprot:PTQ44135.1 hypothetical protein MARPO_0021s0017 [Marchantia polymorpha]
MSGLTARAVHWAAHGAAPEASGVSTAAYPLGGFCASKDSRNSKRPSRVSFSKERRNAGWSSLVCYQSGANAEGSSTGSKSSFRCQALADDQQSVSDEVAFAAHARDLLGDDESQNFFDRLVRAWTILFPSKRRSSSNAEIAKQRLKMILISDRCSVNDEAKRRIVNNIVGALSDFVEIESEDKVQLTVSSDPDLGTVYSVTVPVRRVKPEYQEYSRELQCVALSEEFRTLDLKLEYQTDGLEGQA